MNMLNIIKTVPNNIKTSIMKEPLISVQTSDPFFKQRFAEIITMINNKPIFWISRNIIIMTEN